jgi:hypothetical protein
MRRLFVLAMLSAAGCKCAGPLQDAGIQTGLGLMDLVGSSKPPVDHSYHEGVYP